MNFVRYAKKLFFNKHAGHFAPKINAERHGFKPLVTRRPQKNLGDP